MSAAGNRSSRRKAAKAALAEIFRDPHRIRIRHDLWLETIRQKAWLTDEDLRIVEGAAASYLKPPQPGEHIPELWEWAGWPAPSVPRQKVSVDDGGAK